MLLAPLIAAIAAPPRSISWWWDAPMTADDPGVDSDADAPTDTPRHRQAPNRRSMLHLTCKNTVFYLSSCSVKLNLSSMSRSHK